MRDRSEERSCSSLLLRIHLLSGVVAVGLVLAGPLLSGALDHGHAAVITKSARFSPSYAQSSLTENPSPSPDFP